MIEATVAAAMQLRVLVRAEGVTGVPGVRILQGPPGRGPNAYELVVEDHREAGDEVYESRGIRFYVEREVASRVGPVRVDLEGQDFVIRRIR